MLRSGAMKPPSWEGGGREGSGVDDEEEEEELLKRPIVCGIGKVVVEVVRGCSCMKIVLVELIVGGCMEARCRQDFPL